MCPSLPTLTHPSAPPPTWRIALAIVDPNPHQPRSQMDEKALEELTGSIREHGLLQPITVRKVGARYQVIAGHRRLEAFRRLLAHAERQDESTAERFSTIPAHEKYDVTDEEMALYALVENLQRDDLSPLDAALGLSRFQEANRLSTDALAKRTGLELDRVKRLLRLSRAPTVIQDACHRGLLVDVMDENGAVQLLSSGSPKRERRRLDLMAALEFAKLHAHVTKSTPKKADERTARVVERALSEHWSFRRVQAFCRSSIAAPDSQACDAEESARPPLPLFTNGTDLLIRREQIRSAAPEERAALLQLLSALLQELES
ncbi:MAG TPA: ParB/RepB/Spo0J family partition protein [Anaeromyxobacteraceae bacterium]|nr:ParB/RepB/Spo0J family partition protein [Anaeromyxobacteraceae bacterium]